MEGERRTRREEERKEREEKRRGSGWRQGREGERDAPLPPSPVAFPLPAGPTQSTEP